MNCLSQLSSYTATIVGRTARFIAANRSSSSSSILSFPRKSAFSGVSSCHSELFLNRFHFRCYSARKGRKTASSRLPKVEPEAVMEQEKDAFYVVRKGDIVGVYNSLSDSQAQVGSSVCDPPVSVYKGYSLSKGTEEYLLSHGLKNALYTIEASELKEDLFGLLVPCPFQTCLLEFDGASKGNPGKAGAGAILRSTDGSLICRLREGAGIATNNAAEYRAMILGMRYALKKGFTGIRIKGDSKLVCMQIDGSWKVKNANLSSLYKVAKELKDKFLSFQISHVLRNFNSEADAQANLAINLADGQVQEECVD
ncbi:uncharacterized protein LOC130710852 isoform X6 [Lotus japonicus]|uniref:uncharacterized protein LOC130710852 isoform X6 n=1 Tax=Lotus japonicus TaxID=34305 RepID=UPI00258918F2|nr:uncharacterized protein LOC130710852 isoform X6 [Lotus japonicus]